MDWLLQRGSMGAPYGTPGGRPPTLFAARWVLAKREMQTIAGCCISKGLNL
jgi:hypothetical protein